MSTVNGVTDEQASTAASPLAARLVPYGFARSGQILLAHQHPESIEVWISERTTDAALAEVARNFGALSIVRKPARRLCRKLAHSPRLNRCRRRCRKPCRNPPSSIRQAAWCRARRRRERVRDADARANRAIAASAER